MAFVIPPEVNASTVGDHVVEVAKGVLPKVVYDHNYNSSTYHFDCSGFVYYVFKQVGIDLKSKDDDIQAKLGIEIAKANLQPGDIVYFNSNTSNPKDVTHVAIYIGNGQIIHSLNSAKDGQISNLNTSYYTSHYKGARRVIGVDIVPVPHDGNFYVITDHGWVTVKDSKNVTLGKLYYPEYAPFLGATKYKRQIDFKGKNGYVTSSETYTHVVQYDRIVSFAEPPFDQYLVSAGDTFWFIGERYGVDYNKLEQLNPSIDPNNLMVGSTIRLR
jgi:LysM repeat protein